MVVGQKNTFSCLGTKIYQESLQIIYPRLVGPMEIVYIHMPEDGNPLPLTALSLEELTEICGLHQKLALFFLPIYYVHR